MKELSEPDSSSDALSLLLSSAMYRLMMQVAIEEKEVMYLVLHETTVPVPKHDMLVILNWGYEC